MKKIISALCVLSIISCLFSIRNWEVFTNTSSVYSAYKTGDKMLLGTWGGLTSFDFNSHEFSNTLTNIDGLSDFEIVDLLKYNNTEIYATRNKGVDLFENGEKKISLTSDIGLISNKTNSIANYNDMLFIGTDRGLSVFQMSSTFPYPLLINNYTNENGLLNSSVNSLAINNYGYLFISTSNGLSMVHCDSIAFADKWKTFRANNSNLSTNNIIKIFTKDDKILISSNSGMYLSDMSKIFNSNPWSSYFVTDSVFAVFIDSNNNLWCSFGLWNDTNQNFTNSLDKPHFACVTLNGANVSYFDNASNKYYLTDFVEYDNDIYATNWGGGVTKITRTASGFNLNEFQQDCINSNTVTKIVVDKNSGVWISDGAPTGLPSDKGTKGISNYKNSNWYRYNTENSPLVSNNIYSLEVDNQNRKWFGSWYTTNWSNGISVLDDTDPDNPLWKRIDSGLYNNCISDLKKDIDSNNMWVASYQAGVNILNPDFQVISNFKVNGINLQDIINTEFHNDKVFFGSYANGIACWNNNSQPDFYGGSWLNIPSDLNDGKTNGIATYETNNTNQTWFALDKGVYMYEDFNGVTNWYQYNIDRKRRIWNGSIFVDEILYYYNEERLFGANATTPTCIFSDPFDRIWIGSATAGISVYDEQFDTFTNYTTKNSPLLSNYVTNFAYDPYSGKLYIGTNRGLNSVEIGKEYKTTTTLGDIVAYPNPFYPDRNPVLTLKNKAAETMPVGNTKCKILDLNGNVVRVLTESRFFEFEWDGNNNNGKKCSSGLYFYLIETKEGSRRGKIALIR